MNKRYTTISTYQLEQALRHHPRLSPNAKEACKGVLVDGLPQSFYVEKFGVSKQLISQWIQIVYQETLSIPDRPNLSMER